MFQWQLLHSSVCGPRGSNQFSDGPYTKGQRWKWDWAQAGLKQEHWFESTHWKGWVKQKDVLFLNSDKHMFALRTYIYIYGYKFVNKKPCQEIPNYSSTSFGPMAFQKWPIPRCGSQWIVFPLATHEKQGSWSCKTCGCRIGTQVPPFLSLGRRRCIQSTPWKTYGYCFGTLPRPKKKIHGVLLAFVLRQGGFLDYKL